MTKNHRWLLFQTYPFCHWCGTAVRWAPQEDGKSLADDAATIDHVNGKKRRRPQDVVLACFACNQFRERLKAYGHRKAATPRQRRVVQIEAAAYLKRLGKAAMPPRGIIDAALSLKPC